MKKILINQTKKSISLFLAVLMVLSCWVWVAPQEAEAAKFTPLTQYTVKIKWQLADRKGKYTGGNIKYKTLGDGWGSESGEQTAISSLGDCLTNNKSYEKTFTTTNFPTVIMVTYEGGNTEWGSLTQDGNKARCDVLEILINDKTVWKGTSGYNGANTATFYPDYNAGNDGTSGSGGGTFSWSRPVLVGFNDDTASASDIAVSLNAIGGQDITKTADYNITKYTCYNQYGVKISDPTNYMNNGRVGNLTEQTTYVSGTKNSDDPLTGEDAADIYATANDKDTVVIKPNLQVSNPKGTTGAATYYLVRKYVYDDKFGGSITSKVSAKIDVTYPNYTVTFDGGVSTAKITADKDYTGSYAAQGYHGTNITVPSKTVADGYTFYEYWSKPQPETGAASYNAASDEFAQPCSSEDYASYLTDGGTENNGIVTDKDGVKWYDAGEKLDPTAAKTIDVSENKANFTATWYAWWLAKDLYIKFYDIDGKFLGTKQVKSGQTSADIGWPSSAYNPGEKDYVNGAIKVNADPYLWVHTNGDEVDSRNYTFKSDLILTPKVINKAFTGEYKISFKHPNSGNDIRIPGDTEGNGMLAYRDNIKTKVDSINGNIPATPADVDGALDYRYEFIGWSISTPINGKYHVVLEDADFDVNGNAIVCNQDWIVRGEATYYPVYRRFTQTYAVKFVYKDSSGKDVERVESVKYGDKIVVNETIPSSYATKGFAYDFKAWEYTDAEGRKQSFAFRPDNIVFNSDVFEIAASALYGSTDCEPVVIRATYKDPVATLYNVKFVVVVDDNGKEETKLVYTAHEDFISEEFLNGLTTKESYDNGEALVTFTGYWDLLEDGSEKAYSMEELKAFSPESHVTFKAIYGNPQPFYTVTYIDGAKTHSERVLVGDPIPAWTEEVMNNNGTPDDTSDDFTEDKPYVPSMIDTEGKGTYVFQGWYDEKQTDTEYKATNGNKVEVDGENPATVTGNITLYPQFKFVPNTYTITFMNYNGSVQLAAGKYEYGQNIEALVTVANKAAQSRAADNTYKYEFLGWDKPVPTFCEGKDITFTALYKPVYRYYDVKWYNSKLVDGQWVADKSTEEVEGETIEKYLLATTKHTFESKLYTPSVGNISCNVAAPDGRSYVFAGWAYVDADGNVQKYTRGMAVTGEMEFFATYTLTATTYTVTTIVKNDTVTYKVADGGIAEIPVPQAGYVNEEKHDEFDGWYTDAEYTNAFDLETAISADITLYAKFTESEHDFTNTELKTAPTYYVVGEEFVWCSCNKDETKKTREIACLTDTVKPTGTIYLGELGSWSSTGDPASATDGDPVTLYANPKTTILITASDKGDVNSLYNPSGTGKGIKLIKAFAFPADTVLNAENYQAYQSLAQVIYEDTTEEIINNANYTAELGTFSVADLDNEGNIQYEDGNIKTKSLEHGKEYIIYYTVFDKANNQLNAKVRTAKFIYDSEAPTITISGKSNKADNPKIVTYCESAIVSKIEVGATLKINGVETELTSTSANGVGSYTITKVGTHVIEVTDKSGNTYSEKIIVAAHKLFTTEDDATCTADGYKKSTCITCGYVAENIVTPATGHTVEIIDTVDATCTENGSATYACKVCDLKVTEENKVEWVAEIGDAEAVKFNDSEVVSKGAGENKQYLVYELTNGNKTPAYPELGHSISYDDNDEPIYTITKAPTCSSKGEKAIVCTVCGYTTGKVDIDVVADAHVFAGKIIYVAPECEEDGYTYYACIYCGAESEHKIVYTAEGHKIEWIVDEPETCGENGTMKAVCAECRIELEPATEIGLVNDPNGNYTYVYDENGNIKTEIKTENDEEVTYYQIYRLPKTNRHDYESTEIKATATEAGSITYKCKNCDFEKVETVPKLTTYTVTFVDEDGNTLKTFEDVVVGESVNYDVIPTKANSEDGKYSYKFNAWVDANDKAVKLPVEVREDMVLKATFTESAILYTHQFEVPTTYDEATGDFGKAEKVTTLVGTLGDIRKTSIQPVFALDDSKADADLKKKYSFEFIGWKKIAVGSSGVTEDFTISDDETFVAQFRVVPVEYSVVYYSEGNFVWNTHIAGGQSVTYGKIVLDENGKPLVENDNYVIDYPTKAFDNDAHYEFNGWYTDAACKTEYKAEIITADTRLYAGYTSIKHEYDKDNGVVTQEANCTLPERTEYACSCGHKIEEETSEELGHDYKKETVDGVTTYTCQRVDCDHSYEDEVDRFNVKFVNDDGSKIETITDVVYGQKVVYTGATPTKAADAEFTYTFSHWIDTEDGDKVYSLEEIEELAITDNHTFKACYTSTKRVYRVTYVDFNNNKLQTGSNYEYGSFIPEFTGTNPTRDYDNAFHYEFAGWSKTTADIVTGDVVISPIFTAIKHNYNAGEPVVEDPTCTTPGQTTKMCVCGDKEVLVTSQQALGHTDELNGVKAEHTIIKPTVKENGSDTYICVRCGEPQTKVLNKLASQKIVITVFDKNGEPAANGVAIVTITNKATGEKYTTNTNDKGQAIFADMPAGQQWSVGIVNAEGCDAIPKGGYAGDVSADGTFTGGEEKDSSKTDCTCTCHRKNAKGNDTFWTKLFRFFHKIIAMFRGGKISCCDDPEGY